MTVHGQGALALTDSEFWSSPLESIESQFDDLLDRAHDEGTEALLLDGPRGPIDPGERDTLPLVGLSVTAAAKLSDWSFHRHTVLVATSLTSLKTFAGIASPRRRTVMPAAEPGPPPTGMVAEEMLIDARGALDLPWKNDEYQIWLISRDRLSGSVAVALSSASAAGDGAALQASGEASSNSAGIRAECSASTFPGAGESLTVSGSLELELPERWSASGDGESTGAPSRAIPLSVVTTGGLTPEPQVFQREVVMDPLAAGAANPFSIEIGEHISQSYSKQRLYVWLVCGPYISAPIVLEDA